jgi:hypothetical protein
MGYAAYELEEQLRRDLVTSLEEYAALQSSLLQRTQRAGTFLAGYLLLTVSSQVPPLAYAICLAASMQLHAGMHACVHAARAMRMQRAEDSCRRMQAALATQHRYSRMLACVDAARPCACSLL